MILDPDDLECCEKLFPVDMETRNDLIETARLGHTFRDALVKLEAEADRLVNTLNAYDGAGIPRSDAREAFAFLRQLRTEARKLLEEKHEF